MHEQHQLIDNGPAIQLEIEKVIVERGWGGAEVWASAFYNAEPMTYLRYNPYPDYVKRVAARLKGEMEIKNNAVKQLTGTPTVNLGDVVIGQGDFDPHLERNAIDLLNNSEKQLKAQAERYGLKVSGWVFKDYSMAVGPEQQKLQTEATRLRNSGEVEPEVTRLARTITKELMASSSSGVYLQRFDIIVIREGDDVGNVLIHELTHRAQNYERKMFQIGTMRREYQAYHAEREFLRALPPDLVPEHAKDIWQATDAGLQAHITQEHAGELADEVLMANKFKPLDPGIDSQLALEWFKNMAKLP